jgi:hypothetical protein
MVLHTTSILDPVVQDTDGYHGDILRAELQQEKAEREFTYKEFTTKESLINTLKEMPGDDMQVLLDALTRPTTNANEFFGYMVRRQHNEDYQNAKTPDTFSDEDNGHFDDSESRETE